MERSHHAEFAVKSIRRWWHEVGTALSPEKRDLLITADGGGSNGLKNRRWKKKRQDLANEEQVTITVMHSPPATSTWNTIEHRLFFLPFHQLASQTPHLPGGRVGTDFSHHQGRVSSDGYQGEQHLPDRHQGFR